MCGWMVVWMVVCMYACMHACMDVWMCGCIYVCWTYGCWMSGCMDVGSINVCMYVDVECIDGCMLDVWMLDECKSRLHIGRPYRTRIESGIVLIQVIGVLI